MALLVPVLIALVFGIIEFGWLTRNQLLAANATREGARMAALGKTPTAIETRVKNTAAPLAVVSPNGEIRLRWSDNDGVDGYPYAVTEVSGRNSVPSGKMIKVRIISNHQSLTGLFPFLRNRKIDSFVVMRRE